MVICCIKRFISIIIFKNFIIIFIYLTNNIYLFNFIIILKKTGLKKEAAQNHSTWRAGTMRNHLTRASMEK